MSSPWKLLHPSSNSWGKIIFNLFILFFSSHSLPFLFTFADAIDGLLRSFEIEDEEILASQVPLIVKHMDPSDQGKISQSQFVKVAFGLFLLKRIFICFVIRPPVHLTFNHPRCLLVISFTFWLFCSAVILRFNCQCSFNFSQTMSLIHPFWFAK